MDSPSLLPSSDAKDSDAKDNASPPAPRGSPGLSVFPYTHPPRLPEGEQVDVRALFPASTGSLSIEIGPGRGAFSLAWVEVDPAGRLLAIEVRRKWAALLDERFQNVGYGHRARAVCEDARLALGRLGPEASVARVFVHFPDPWWKKRHQKRFVIGDILTAQIARLLVPGGHVFVQTDVGDRAERYEQELAAQPEFVPAGDVPGSPWLAANPYGAKSNREKRVEADGLPVWRLRFARR